jgi:hypothetical protein
LAYLALNLGPPPEISVRYKRALALLAARQHGHSATLAQAANSDASSRARDRTPVPTKKQSQNMPSSVLWSSGEAAF